MAKMKDLLIDEIETLARLSGYDPEELLDIYFRVMDENNDEDEPFDTESFVMITMEHDW